MIAAAGVTPSILSAWPKVLGLILFSLNLTSLERPLKLSYDLIDSVNNKKVLGKGEKLNIVIAKKLKEKGLKSISVSNEEIIGKYIVKFNLIDQMSSSWTVIFFPCKQFAHFLHEQWQCVYTNCL